MSATGGWEVNWTAAGTASQECACCRKEPAVLKERDLGWVCAECWVGLTAADKYLRRVGIEGCTRGGAGRGNL